MDPLSCDAQPTNIWNKWPSSSPVRYHYACNNSDSRSLEQLSFVFKNPHTVIECTLINPGPYAKMQEDKNSSRDTSSAPPGHVQDIDAMALV